MKHQTCKILCNIFKRTKDFISIHQTIRIKEPHIKEDVFSWDSCKAVYIFWCCIQNKDLHTLTLLAKNVANIHFWSLVYEKKICEVILYSIYSRNKYIKCIWMSVFKNCSLQLLLESIKIVITFLKLYNTYRYLMYFVIIPFVVSF